jgi:ribosome-interacting GTPase 1
MATNLTPQYLKVQEGYRRAQTPQEQVECLEKMLELVPKHKASEKLQADLKTRLKEAREELHVEKSAPKKTAKSYKFPRQGAGQIVIVGAPNAGKSRVLKELTHAQPEVAPYPFTTREPQPGMMPWEDVAVQLIDTPPITRSIFEPYLSSLVRTADAVLLCFDGSSDDAPEETLDVIRHFTERKTLLAKESGFAADDYSVIRIQTLLVVTRGDDAACSDRIDFFHEMGALALDELRVELHRSESVAELRNRVYQLLNVMRCYTKAPGKPADYTSPFTLPVGGTVEDLASKVHKDIAEKLTHARVWGSGLHDGQTVGREHVLHDRDLVELHA